MTGLQWVPRKSKNSRNSRDKCHELSKFGRVVYGACNDRFGDGFSLLIYWDLLERCSYLYKHRTESTKEDVAPSYQVLIDRHYLLSGSLCVMNYNFWLSWKAFTLRTVENDAYFSSQSDRYGLIFLSFYIDRTAGSRKKH